MDFSLETLKLCMQSCVKLSNIPYAYVILSEMERLKYYDSDMYHDAISIQCRFNDYEGAMSLYNEFFKNHREYVKRSTMIMMINLLNTLRFYGKALTIWLEYERDLNVVDYSTWMESIKSNPALILQLEALLANYVDIEDEIILSIYCLIIYRDRPQYFETELNSFNPVHPTIAFFNAMLRESRDDLELDISEKRLSIFNIQWNRDTVKYMLRHKQRPEKLEMIVKQMKAFKIAMDIDIFNRLVIVAASVHNQRYENILVEMLKLAPELTSELSIEARCAVALFYGSIRRPERLLLYLHDIPIVFDTLSESVMNQLLWACCKIRQTFIREVIEWILTKNMKVYPAIAFLSMECLLELEEFDLFEQYFYYIVNHTLTGNNLYIENIVTLMFKLESKKRHDIILKMYKMISFFGYPKDPRYWSLVFQSVRHLSQLFYIAEDALYAFRNDPETFKKMIRRVLKLLGMVQNSLRADLVRYEKLWMEGTFDILSGEEQFREVLLYLKDIQSTLKGE